MNDQIIALEKQYWNGMETHDYNIVKNRLPGNIRKPG